MLQNFILRIYRITSYKNICWILIEQYFCQKVNECVIFSMQKEMLAIELSDKLFSTINNFKGVSQAPSWLLLYSSVC